MEFGGQRVLIVRILIDELEGFVSDHTTFLQNTSRLRLYHTSVPETFGGGPKA